MITGGIKEGLNEYQMPVGNIKIGKKGAEKTTEKGKKWRLPVKLGHFIVTTTETGPDDNFLLDEAVMENIGEEKPKSIRVRFPFDDPALIFQTSYQMYNGKKLQCEGNGVISEIKDKSGKVTEGKCAARECEFMQPDNKGNVQCKPSGRLACHLPDSPHFGGIYMYRTHGWNAVKGIKAALENYHKQTGEILQGLPFKLIFTKKATEDHGNVPVPVLVMDGIELTEMRRLARVERQDRIEGKINMVQIEHDIIASGVLEDHDNPKDIAEEYYPPAEIEDGNEADEAGTSSEDVQAEMEAKDKASEPEEKDEASTEKTDKDLF